jgi:RimJ/RimL family protein N-acetyltransferase
MITFRDVRSSDLELIRLWHSDPLIVRFYNSGDALPDLVSLDRYAPSDEGETLIVESEDRPIGLLSVGFLAPHSVALVYYLAAEARGRGLGSQMIAAFLMYAKGRDWRRIQAKVTEVNVPSWKALVANGFVLIDRAEDRVRYPGADQLFDELTFVFDKTISDDDRSRSEDQLIPTLANEQELATQYLKLGGKD